MKRIFVVTGIITFSIFVSFFVAPVFRGDIIIQADYFVGPIRIHIYSWTFFAAVVAGFFWVRKNAVKFGISKSVAENLVFVNVVAGFVGARVHHVLSAWDFYSKNLILIPQVWQGGLGIYGGVIAGICATWVYCRIKRIDFLSVADLLAPALVLGQAIGRWGNFFNQEAYGVPTELPWKMFVDAQFRFAPYLEGQFFHPTFLYESIWAVVVFAILARLTRSRPPLVTLASSPTNRSGTSKSEEERGGKIFASYLILYSLGRFFIEALRADSTLFFNVPANQILALALTIVGLLIFVRSTWQRKEDFFN